MPGSPVRPSVPVPAEGGAGAGRPHGPGTPATYRTPEQQYKPLFFYQHAQARSAKISISVHLCKVAVILALVQQAGFVFVCPLTLTSRPESEYLVKYGARFPAAAASRHHWLPLDLHSDAALAVIQTLGRFMASYFTNQPLYIRPPHHVASLPPLHLPHRRTYARLLVLTAQPGAFIGADFSRRASSFSCQCGTFAAAMPGGGFQSGAPAAAV